MNMVTAGHFAEHVLHESKEFKAGSILHPISEHVRRPIDTVPSLKEGNLREYEAKVVRGINFYRVASQIYREHDEYHNLKNIFRHEIAPKYLPIDFHHVGAIQGIATDILIDGYVMNSNPESIDKCEDVIRAIGRDVLRVVSTDPDGFAEALEDLKCDGIPGYDYLATATDELYRRLAVRPSLALEDKYRLNVKEALERYQERVDERVGIILLDVTRQIDIHSLSLSA